MIEHAQWVRRQALALVGREDVAEDLMQETFLVALCSPPDASRPLRPWLAGVLRNLAYKRRRSDGRRRRREISAITEAPETPERLVDRAESARRVRELLRELEEPYRSTLQLRYGEMLSSVEIARRQRIPAGTVRWRLKSGVDRLRAAW